MRTDHAGSHAFTRKAVRVSSPTPYRMPSTKRVTSPTRPTSSPGSDEPTSPNAVLLFGRSGHPTALRPGRAPAQGAVRRHLAAALGGNQ